MLVFAGVGIYQTHKNLHVSWGKPEPIEQEVASQFVEVPNFQLAATQKDKFWIKLHNEIDALEVK